MSVIEIHLLELAIWIGGIACLFIFFITRAAAELLGKTEKAVLLCIIAVLALALLILVITGKIPKLKNLVLGTGLCLILWLAFFPIIPLGTLYIFIGIPVILLSSCVFKTHFLKTLIIKNKRDYYYKMLTYIIMIPAQILLSILILYNGLNG